MNNKSLIIISIMFFILFGGAIRVFATTASQVKEQINNINDQIKELDKEIAKISSQITKTGEQKNTLTKAVQELTLTRNKLLIEKTQTEKKIKSTGLVIDQLSDNIWTKQESIDRSEKSLKNMMYSLYQKEEESFLERILSKKGLDEISREYNDTLSINRKVRDYIYELTNQKNELHISKSQKLEEQDKLNNLKKTLTAKELAVLNTKKEKDNLLIQTKNQETTYQKLLAEQIKKRDAFEKSLSEYEDQLKFILNPKSLPKAGTAVFSWPLKNVFITQLFGYTSASARLYRSGTHSGLDFRASIGTEVMAMGKGTVMGTGDTDIYCKGASFGKWVFIKYDNGLSSTFGHLSSIVAKKGQKVKAGDIVALSGNTGHTTGPHLHLTVYASDGVKIDSVPSLSCSGKTFIMPIAASTSYLDPMLYLPKISPSFIKK